MLAEKTFAIELKRMRAARDEWRDKADEIVGWLRRSASAEKDPLVRSALIEAAMAGVEITARPPQRNAPR
jgi:hypothetical protein